MGAAQVPVSKQKNSSNLSKLRIDNKEWFCAKTEISEHSLQVCPKNHSFSTFQKKVFFNEDLAQNLFMRPQCKLSFLGDRVLEYQTSKSSKHTKGGKQMFSSKIRTKRTNFSILKCFS